MSKESRAILLVADISGFTPFMKYHTVSLSHAKQVIVRLLKAIIRGSKFPLKIAELEGDAVFFYALVPQKEASQRVEKVKSQIIMLFNSFYEEINVLKAMDVCSCEACERIQDLKLKIVIHTGIVDFEKINSNEKIFGLDVIIVHRMLKKILCPLRNM